MLCHRSVAQAGSNYEKKHSRPKTLLDCSFQMFKEICKIAFFTKGNKDLQKKPECVSTNRCMLKGQCHEECVSVTKRYVPTCSHKKSPLHLPELGKPQPDSTTYPKLGGDFKENSPSAKNCHQHAYCKRTLKLSLFLNQRPSVGLLRRLKIIFVIAKKLLAAGSKGHRSFPCFLPNAQ